jgi:long-chain acyl-CoA synthetase
LGDVVTAVNAKLPPIERIRRFIIAKEAFTTGNGQLTPTLKIRRHVVRGVYGDALNALYDGRGAAA